MCLCFYCVFVSVCVDIYVFVCVCVSVVFISFIHLLMCLCVYSYWLICAYIFCVYICVSLFICMCVFCEFLLLNLYPFNQIRKIPFVVVNIWNSLCRIENVPNPQFICIRYAVSIKEGDFSFSSFNFLYGHCIPVYFMNWTYMYAIRCMHTWMNIKEVVLLKDTLTSCLGPFFGQQQWRGSQVQSVH